MSSARDRRVPLRFVDEEDRPEETCSVVISSTVSNTVILDMYSQLYDNNVFQYLG